MRKKGSLDYIAWTMFLLIAVSIMVIILFFIDARDSFAGTSPSSVDFIAANNKPYLLATIVLHLFIEDRQFMEHAAEIISTGDVSRSSSNYLDVYLKEFFRKYKDNKFISVSIRSAKDAEEKEIFYVDNIPKKCGDDLSGLCIDAIRVFDFRSLKFTIDRVGCTDGRVPIEPELYINKDNRCKSFNEVCCVEGRTKNGFWPDGTITCGANREEEGDIDPDDPGVCDYSGNGCSAGRIEIDDKGFECPIRNSKSACCVPLEGDVLIQLGIASRAQIPVLYRDKTGIIEVTVR